LVKVGGLDAIIEATRELTSATRELTSASRVDVCVGTVKNALREASLGSTKKISKPTLSTKN
jgi:hypothetical protein